MNLSGLIIYILVGLAAGWLAGIIMKGGSLGLVMNIVIGIIGSFIGGFLFRFLGIHIFGIIGSIIAALVGAMILLFVVSKIKR